MSEQLRAEFERVHCGGNPHNIRRNTTNGDYVLPSVQDAWAGYRSAAEHRQGLPDVDKLANIIRKVDGNHSLGAGALAEAILKELAS